MIKRLLIANRGEIAVRVARTARRLGIGTVSVFAKDDAASLHRFVCDEAVELAHVGSTAYLDVAGLVEQAVSHSCDALHPGYGFLSESADLARACAAAGVTFVGPSAEVLEALGNKAVARELAQKCGVPVLRGTERETSLLEMESFFGSLGASGAMMVKALSGGGGRGMRPVFSPEEIEPAFHLCQSEAQAAFGVDALYVEQLIASARHIEVQVLGDGQGGVALFGDRDCSLQRRYQKLVEIAPSPFLPEPLREELAAATRVLAEEVAYKGLGTFEFLVDQQSDPADPAFYFVEANPRIQVEHTVTEEAFGVDLVANQLKVAGGATIDDLGLTNAAQAQPKGFAVQLRINAETMLDNGDFAPSGGEISRLILPSGPGVRIDTGAQQGSRINPLYDALVAKLIVHSETDNFERAAKTAYHALCEADVKGADTNIDFLKALLTTAGFGTSPMTTSYIAEHLEEIRASLAASHPRWLTPEAGATTARTETKIDAAPDNALTAPLNGVIVEVLVNKGDLIETGQHVFTMESMKMHHRVAAEFGGEISKILVGIGDQVEKGRALLLLEGITQGGKGREEETVIDLEAIRPDLREYQDRLARTQDSARSEAVKRRHGQGQRTARENIKDLIDDGSFVEYGGLMIAGQRGRRNPEDLRALSPADGLITGLATVNADQFPPEASQCLVMAYDPTVFAGTQGLMGHRKKDRVLDLALELKVPLVLFAEGGGGRPGDTDIECMVDTPSFLKFAELSGKVPVVGVTSRYCFAGNAALLGCCDVIIATQNASIGMAGPAMIEGGGLGSFSPGEVGPVSVQAPNGTIDIVVEDEAASVAATKKYLSYFQGRAEDWTCEDQRALRHVIPEDRLRVYDIRTVIEVLADEGSTLELRRDFGDGIVTTLARVEGHPFGIVANNVAHLGGAIDRDAADKAVRFMKLCNAFQLPILNLCDTPGFMIGPDAEKTAQVKAFSDMFIAAAQLTTPTFSIVLRKGYGLGALGMCAGSFHTSIFCVSWPSGEFGGMGLEGSVRLAFKKELEAIEDPQARQKRFEELVAAEYEKGKAVNIASYFEIDNVIDPAETRHLLVRGFEAARSQWKGGAA